MTTPTHARSPWAVLFVLLMIVALTLTGCGGSAQAATPEAVAQPAVEKVVAAAAPAQAGAVVAPVQSEPQTAQPAPPAADSSTDAEAEVAPPSDLERTTNLLLLGSDRRPNTPNWRTDVMMILAIDNASKQVGVVSLPRDLYVDTIPGHRGNKINVIDYVGEQDEPDGGGPKLLAAVLEDKIGVRIDHYIRFDFEAFKKLVDALGGVEIEVDCGLYDPQGYDQGGLPLALDPGIHRLNGGEALSYVRSRLVGGDLERERRQQRLAWAVRTQILNENLLPRVPAMYAALNDNVQTDLGLMDAIGLVRFALKLDSEKVHGFVVNDPTMIKEGYAGQMWVWYPNWPNIAKAAQEVFSTPPLLETNTKDEKCP
ncbi:MAG: LCP family protein [Anaerolineales bacterium]|nr:LCP family protein [Anaerolineales bacterium]